MKVMVSTLFLLCCFIGQGQVPFSASDVGYVGATDKSSWLPNHVSGLDSWFDMGDKSNMFQDAAGTTPITAQGQSVALIKDKSGNAHHLSQTNAAKMPIWVNINSGSLRFTGNTNSGSQPQFLTNHLYSIAQPNTVIMRIYIPAPLYRIGAATNTVPSIILAGDSGGGYNNIYISSMGDLLTTDPRMRTSLYAGAVVGDEYLDTSIPHIRTVVFDGGNCVIRTDRIAITATGFVGAGTKSKLALAAYSDGTVPTMCLVSDLIIYNRHLTQAEIDRVELFLWEKQYRYQTLMLMDGDSIQRGASSTIWGDWGFQCASNMNSGITLVCRGIASQTCAQANSAHDDVAFFSSYKRPGKIIYTGAFVNDLRLGSATTNAYFASLQTWISNGKSFSPRIKVLLGTMTPQEIQLPTYTQAIFEQANQYIRNNYLAWGANGLADIGADPNIGVWGSNTNLTYYDPSKVHPNDMGYSVMESIWRPLILSQ